MNKDYMISEYEKLCECKSLGFYNTCEMYSAFIIDKIKKNKGLNLIKGEKRMTKCLDYYDEVLKVGDKVKSVIIDDKIVDDEGKYFK